MRPLPRLLPILAAACASIAVVASIAAPASVLAGTPNPRMIRELTPGPDGVNPNELYVLGVVGGRALFRVNADPSIGGELYRIDGTRAGTGLVKDIFPGPTGSETGTPFVAMNGLGYFTATDPAHGHELWRSNGTSAGTHLVADIGPDNADSAYLWGRFGNRLVVQQTDGTGIGQHGEELWGSTGTSAGTKRMTDVAPGPADSLFAGVTPLGAKLLFISDNGTSGLELFRSDGTPGGTHLVKDVNEEPGGILSYPGGGTTPVRWKGAIWYYASDGVSGDPGDHGGELWRSDGTAGGTRMVKDIAPGTDSTFIAWLRPLGDHLLFRAEGPVGGGELWTTDGTARGTHRVKDLYPGPTSSQPFPMGVIGGRLLLAANGGPTVGWEVFVTDGTRVGTKLLKDIAPGGADSDPRDWVTLGGRIYFSAANAAKGRELWVTNGTPAGTRRLSDINPGKSDANVGDLVAVGKRIVFFADDGTHGLEPWVYVP
ncbi:MAG: hypothetical protein U0869_26720 [Chloroflexota bacterium]